MTSQRVNIGIRRARGADSGELTRIAHAAKRHWGYPERLIRTWRDALTVSVGFIARNPVYCAVSEARLVGFYALSGRGDSRALEHMWVDPDFIGMGIGAELFRHAVAISRAAGATMLRIASDPNAEGFYRRMGARLAGEVASMPRGRRLPLLVLDLGSSRE